MRQNLYGRTQGFDNADVPEPASPCGQYPDDVWAKRDYSAAALSNDDIPEPASPSGQYPDDVWAKRDYSAAAFADETSSSLVEQNAATNNQATPDATFVAVDDIHMALKSVDYADDIGTAPDSEYAVEDLTPQLPLDYQEMYRIMREVAVMHSGDDLYSAVAADVEYTTPGQSAYQQQQFGLAFGFLKFTQASRHLGSLLQIMKRREPDLFAEMFGPHSEELLTTLNAPTAQERLQPVGGEPLWSESWMARFRRAGEVPVFQAAQNEEAIENLFRPLLAVAYELGFITDRGLAMVFDRVVTHGLGAGLRWVVGAAGVLRTTQQRMIAMQVLGYENLAQFQAAAIWLPQDGQFGPETHAALVGALRDNPVIPLPTTNELLHRLVNTADGSAHIRLARLLESPNFEDIVYSLE